MKKSKPIVLMLPAPILSVVSSHSKRDYLAYLVHYIIYKPIRDKRYPDYVPINKLKLESLFNCKLNTYIKLLLNYELIESDGNYIPGVKSLYYRLNPKHNLDCSFYELQPGTKLYTKLMKLLTKEKTNYSKLPLHLNKMRVAFMNLQFDYDKAVKYIKNVPDEQKRLSYSIAINQLEDTRFRYFKRNTTNYRLDTNLTNLKKELRQFIVGDYVSIDLKNSQFFFLYILFRKITETLNYFHLKKLEFNQTNLQERYNIKHHIPLCCDYSLIALVKIFGIQCFKSMLLIRKNREISLFTNLSKYKTWVLNGIFYDEFMNEFDGHLTRDEVKKIMFEVLFSKNVCYQNFRQFIPFEKEKKIFSTVFPVLYDMIFLLKEGDNAKLAIYLQKIESEVFIDTIASQLVNSGIIPFTIHDSVIVPANQKEQALRIIESVFNDRFKIVPQFNIETINHK